MHALLMLFLVAILAGSRSEKSGFSQIAGLMLVIFLGLCFIWNDTHHWPGLLSPAFVAQVGQWIVAMVLGLMIGGLLFGGARKSQKSQ